MVLQDHAIRIFLVLLIRYVVLAGIPFLVFYTWKRKKWLYKKIQPWFPANKYLVREFFFSVITFIVFTCVGYLIVRLHNSGHTLIYDKVSEHGVFYFILSIVLMIIMHDTYFYWTHRIMHLKLFFPTFHKIHHLSTNPTPWAAFSFHPLEAIVEAGILPVIVFLIPVHPAAIFIFLFFMTVNRNEKDNHR